MFGGRDRAEFEGVLFGESRAFFLFDRSGDFGGVNPAFGGGIHGYRTN